MATHSSILAWRIPWTEESVWATVLWVTKSQTQLNEHTHTQGTHKELYAHNFDNLGEINQFHFITYENSLRMK